MKTKNYFKNKKCRAFSLMELLISMAIFVLAIAGTTVMVQMAYKYYNFIFNQAEILTNIQKSINEMSKVIRETRQADNGAFNIEKADYNEIIVFSNIDSAADVERVRYYKDGNCLKKGVIKPSGTPAVYSLASEQTSSVSCNITNNASEPIFAYYSDYPSSSTLLSTPADQHKIKVIKIFLRVSSTGLRPLPVSKTITDYIRPRNINKEDDN